MWTARYSKIYQLQSVVLLDLLIMAGGLSMVFSCKMELTVRAVLVAVISTIAWPLRNLFLKRFGESWRDPLQKFGVMSIYGFLFLLPFVLVKFAYSKTIPLIKPEVLFWRSTIQAVGDFLSIMVLESISPLLHSVLVIIMEFSSVVVGVLYFHLPLCWTMLVGITVFFLAVAVYYLYVYYLTTTTHDAHQGPRLYLLFTVLAIFVLLGPYFFIKLKSRFPTEYPNSVHTFWVHNQPPSNDVLLNIQAFQAKLPNRDIHVHCATFRCVEEVRLLRSPKLSATFLTFNSILRDSPLEQWFSQHVLHKLLSRRSFEMHLHEAVRLALLWHYGGISLDPFVRIQELSSQELGYQLHPWVSSISDERLSGTLELCNFPPRHPFIRILSSEFLKEYSNATSRNDFKNFLQNFYRSSLNALTLFCKDRPQDCPRTYSVEVLKTKSEYISYAYHFGLATEKSGIKPDLALENLASVQFLPFVDISFSNISHHSTIYNDTTIFVNTRLRSNSSLLHLQNITDPIMSSISIDFDNNLSAEQIAFLRHRASIGCHDTRTMKLLTNNNISVYYSELTSLLVKGDDLSKTPRNTVYLVDVHEEVIKQLPAEIRRNSVHLEYLSTDNSKSNLFNWMKIVYTQLQKYSCAKLIITQSVQCAFVAAAIHTPVVFINSSGLPGMAPQMKSHDSGRKFPVIFNVVNLDKNSSTKNTFAYFNLSNIRANPNVSLLMRLRATAWNSIRKRKSLRETALRYGIVPFPRPSSTESETSLTFHLLFTTSRNSTIPLLWDLGRVSGSFSWRHLRCVEAIFYHHPFARVIIHSNTLSQSTFDVFTEVGYDIEVKSYNLSNMVKNTSAEVFVRDKLAHARKGPNWYSHETDLLRLLILFKWGGIYMDTDMHVVRPLNDLEPNVLGRQSDIELNGAFLKFDKGHPFLKACIEEFSYHYSSGWADNGPGLLTRIFKGWNARHVEYTVKDRPPTNFYMFFYKEIRQRCFDDTSGRIFELKKNILNSEAYVVHLNSKITAQYGVENKIKEGTLCKHILNSFCVLCDKVY